MRETRPCDEENNLARMLGVESFGTVNWDKLVDLLIESAEKCGL